MWQKVKNWIVKIQNSDECVKRRYLIFSTAATMVVIICLWLIYLKLATPSAVQTSQPELDTASKTQFWQIFKNGLNVVGGALKQNIQNITSQIFKGSTVEIK